MPAFTRSLAVAGLSALLVAAFTLPGVVVAQRDRLAPTACMAAPGAVADDAIPAAATPVPVSANEAGSGADLSLGEAGDPETVAQITAAVQELAGCLNTADAPRFAALLTDAAIAAGIDRNDFTPLFLQDGALEPGSGGVPWEIVWVRVRNVRVLPDGPSWNRTGPTLCC